MSYRHLHPRRDEHSGRPRRAAPRRLVGLAAVLLVSFGAFAPLCAAPVHTNKARFRIPFQYDPAELDRMGAVEIQLFVSRDQGHEWTQSQAVAPTAGKFTFEAPQEGEFWFAVRTIDSRRQRHPSGPLQPGLRVVVDQTAPLLELTLRESSPGVAELTWKSLDEHLDVGSLKLSAQNPQTGEWALLDTTPEPSGRTTWPVARGGAVAVRGSISDFSGNAAAADAQVMFQATNGRMPAEPDFSQPVAGPEEGRTLAPQTAATAPGAAPADAPIVIAPQHRSSSSVPRDQLTAGDAAALPSVTRDTSMQSATADRASAPAGARRINSRSFKIGYELDDVGPSGVSGIDLYITEDGGDKWYHYGADPDQRSPFDVTLEREGTYGFSLRARSGVGMGTDPPQPGEAPASVVVVDLKAPQARLLPVKQGNGLQSSQVVIEWMAEDDRLADRPIALYYSLQPTGPWETITGWQPNTGQHVWTIPASVTKKVYLRLEARDAAGNLTRVDSDQPVLVDLATPKARIVDVESIRMSDPRN